MSPCAFQRTVHREIEKMDELITRSQRIREGTVHREFEKMDELITRHAFGLSA